MNTEKYSGFFSSLLVTIFNIARRKKVTTPVSESSQHLNDDIKAYYKDLYWIETVSDVKIRSRLLHLREERESRNCILKEFFDEVATADRFQLEEADRIAVNILCDDEKEAGNKQMRQPIITPEEFVALCYLVLRIVQHSDLSPTTSKRFSEFYKKKSRTWGWMKSLSRIGITFTDEKWAFIGKAPQQITIGQVVDAINIVRKEAA